MAHYIGGKGQSGVYQKIISMMPPHKVYIEGFLGNGSVMRNKKPAEVNIGIDADSHLLISWMKMRFFGWFFHNSENVRTDFF